MCRYDVKKVKNIEATLLLGITILIEWVEHIELTEKSKHLKLK